MTANQPPNTQAEDELDNLAELAMANDIKTSDWPHYQFCASDWADFKSKLLRWRDAYAQQKAKEAFKASTYQNVDGHAKYWSEIGDYNATATHKFFPQEWFDKRFMPALQKVLGK